MLQKAGNVRFIPAGAGNSDGPVTVLSVLAVHPRWRGEQEDGIQRFEMELGSSPLARGTGNDCCTHRGSVRFIPAGAGNSAYYGGYVSVTSVHPRWRGEQGVI